jgi:hypothetical protein
MYLDTSALGGGAEAFAAANGMAYAKEGGHPRFGGAVFEYLQNATVTDVFRDETIEVGTISGRVGGSQTTEKDGWTVTASYDTSAVKTYGYIAITLERAVPQLVLDSKRNGSSIPMMIGGGQKLALEGDFQKHFTLYAPKGYERDALYIFTPDLMALLIDETGDFDVEVVDNMLFVYSTQPFDTTSAATWQRIGRIRDVVGAKAIAQTDYYADDRRATDSAAPIAEGGRRLKLGLSTRDFVLIGAAALVGVAVIFSIVGFILIKTFA